MKTDTIMKVEGMDALVKRLGMVGAERFIMLVQRESSNYTEWRSSLFEGKSLEEIHTAAADFYERNRITEQEEV